MVTELATEPATAERRLASDPRVISGAIGACVGLLIAAVFGIRALASAQAVAAARPDVEVATVTSSAIRAELLYTGTVQGAQQANVSSLTAGMIAALHVDTGATVRAGDRLASLDAGALPLQLLQARADLQSAEAKRAGILGGLEIG
ncbi:MAG: biotin/lipoyl-binding protein, partial [Chloroflexota bacterium]